MVLISSKNDTEENLTKWSLLLNSLYNILKISFLQGKEYVSLLYGKESLTSCCRCNGLAGSRIAHPSSF